MNVLGGVDTRPVSQLPITEGVMVLEYETGQKDGSTVNASNVFVTCPSTPMR